MAPDEVETADRLDRYLDGLVHGRVPDAAGLDPTLTAAVRRVHASGAAPVADAAFLARLEEELMHDATLANGHVPPALRNGRSPAVAVPPRAVPRLAPSRWPVTELVVAAVVLLAIATGFGAYRIGPAEPSGGSGFGASPDGTPGATGPVACELEPRREPIVRTGTAATAIGLPGTPTASLSLPNDVPPAPSGNPFGLPEELLPTGRPADADAVAGIRGALVQYAVCRGEAGLAAFSDDYFRRAELQGTFDDDVSRVLWPVPLHGVARPEDVPLRDARVLPDGRVGAVVEMPGMGRDFLGNFFVFVERDDRWLIDEFVVVRSPSPTGAEPAATPTPFPFPGVPRFEPTHRVVGSAAVNLRTSPSMLLVPIVALPSGTRLQDLNREAPTAYAEDDGTRWRLFRVETGQEGWLREADVEPYRSGTTADRAAPTKVATSAASPAADRAGPAPSETPEAFASTHQIRAVESINLRPDPSFDNPPLQALAPLTPLQYIDEEVPIADSAKGGRWLRFRTEGGAVGWVREIDVEPYRG